MTSAASAMMLLTTELMAVTMSVHFMLTSFPVDINYYIKNFDYPEKPLKYKHIRRISD